MGRAARLARDTRRSGEGERAIAGPAGVRARPVASPFLLDGPRDLALVTLAPLWIVPALFVAAGAFGDRAVNDWVMALGAIGHHLPGMLRAYGDRALFRRFRARLLVAPPALAALCLACAFAGLHAVVLLAFLWGVWHGLMQTYGFARIYAAKSGDRSPLAARSDFALLAAWFVAAVVLSPLRGAFLFTVYGVTGLPLPSPAAGAIARRAAIALPLLFTAAFFVRLAFAPRAVDEAARRARRLHLGLIATSVAFWWHANVRIRHPLLGLPLFELFHDVQYLAIVWAVNRRRAEAAPGELLPAMRALFRPGLAGALVYAIACAAYGAVQLAGDGATRAGQLVTGLLAASQLLHFYLDGFLWKVREPDTAAALALDPPQAARPALASLGRGRVAHAARWSLLLVPCAVLIASERSSPRAEEDVIDEVADLEPGSSATVARAAETSWARGDRSRAIARLRSVVASDPDYRPARENLALSLGDLLDDARARGDEPAARRLEVELRALRPRLEGRIARWLDERVGPAAAPLPDGTAAKAPARER